MILKYLYPQGRPKALTMSYDDGVTQDRRLVAIFNRYGIRGTFHLNSALLGTGNRIRPEEVADLYAGHEVSCHSAHHPYLERIAPASVLSEVLDDRRKLEELCGTPVVGMSYPFGTHNPQVIELLRSCGIVYSRTTASHGSFALPDEFLLWHPTCHHSHDLDAKAEAFLNLAPYRELSLFYVWGHAYEFDREEPSNNWKLIEAFCEKMSGRDDIWYATNLEIFEYVAALRSLVISVDGKLLRNRSGLDLWVQADGKPVKIPAGAGVTL